MSNPHSYHHGDLPRTLMQTSVQLIEQKGVAALSLREVARTAGVSHGAPAHHFKDKAGLLTAIAAQGLRELAAQLAAAAKSTRRRGTNRLVASGESYIRFAIRHPAYFALMYRPDLVNEADPDYQSSLRLPGNVLTQLIRETLEDMGESAGSPAIEAAAMTLWSQVHGFATLWQAGNFGDPADETQLNATMRSLFKGLPAAFSRI